MGSTETEETTMDLTTQTPEQVDTALAAIYERGYRANYDAAIAKDRAKDAEKYHAKFVAGERTYSAYDEAYVTTQRERWAAAVAAARAVWAETDPYDEEFIRRGGWTRAWLVVTSGQGHVHNTMECFTCRPTTEFAWLPQYSGHPESEIVADAGERACTFCYPSAPAETLSRPTRIYSKSEQEKQAARIEREAKRAAKEAKKIYNPDGSPIRTKHAYSVATEVTAQNEYVGSLVTAASYRRWDPRDAEHAVHLESLAAEYEADAEILLVALAHKRGTTLEEQREALAAKVAAKIRKEVR
jgi:hypothetical protein